MISQKLDVSTMVCGSVNGCGSPVLNMGSRILSVKGNEAGFGGGVVSGVNVGMCRPSKNYAPKVRAEGQYLLRHDTVMEMNCAGPEGKGNIEGKIQYTSFNDSTANAKDENHKNRKFSKTVKVGKDQLPVDVYETDGTGASYVYNPQTGKREIWLGRDRSAGSEANEMQHAEDDARDGELNGILHDENGKELTGLEPDIRSDQASIEELERNRKERLENCKGVKGCAAEYVVGGAIFLESRFRYQSRKQAFERAQKKIEEGDFEGARKELEDYQTYQDKIPEGPSVRPSQSTSNVYGPTNPTDLKPWKIPPVQ